MQVRDPEHRTGAEHHHAAVVGPLKRLVDALAVTLRPKPDLTLVNEKFTDSFERERTERLQRNRW